MYNSKENKACYFPPLLSNGEIAFAPDAEGMLGYTADEYRKKGVNGFDGIVVRAGRRTARSARLNARLFPLGTFTFHAGAPLAEWSQDLLCEKGCFESDCIYADGMRVRSCGFIHPESNLYCLKKTFRGITGTKRVAYDVTLAGYDDAIGEYMTVLDTADGDGVGRIAFKMWGMRVFCGEIRALLDRPCTAEKIRQGVRLALDVADGETVSFFFAVEDDMEGADASATLDGYERMIKKKGFSGLFADCERHYADFYALGYVRTSDERLNRIYSTALYSIKCNTTKHSVAVGLNNGAWDGKYFAFDEYTSYLALLGANRMSLARRVPSYRLYTCLPIAIKRASDCHKTENSEDMALFHWQTGEEDVFELANNGCWIDHVFHLPLIGIGAFQYFEYTADRDFLRACYKMIRACAKYFTQKMIYRDGTRYYLGKCCDLERLGAAVENPFMTVCGVIKLLRCCAEAARILETDEEYARECVFLSDRLFENLPAENGKYVPFVGCKQKSIAVFAGKFPFDVLREGDAKMLDAWADYEASEGTYGNMYPWGKSISPWYACWKAMGYARVKNADKSFGALKQAYPSAGVFDEMFEINEQSTCSRPWFSTAAGIFVCAVNEMLLQSEGQVIRLLPAFPKTTDASFRLAAAGGVTVEAEVKDGRLLKAVVLRDGTDVTAEYTVVF